MAIADSRYSVCINFDQSNFYTENWMLIVNAKQNMLSCISQISYFVRKNRPDHNWYIYPNYCQWLPWALILKLNTSKTLSRILFTGEPFSVRTSAPEVVTPGNFQYELNEKSNTISLSYDPVVCASSYKIYQILDNEQESVYQETNLNLVSIDSPEPCSDFRWILNQFCSVFTIQIDGTALRSFLYH